MKVKYPVADMFIALVLCATSALLFYNAAYNPWFGWAMSAAMVFMGMVVAFVAWSIIMYVLVWWRDDNGQS